MTPIEEDARRNFNRTGLPAGYDPIAPVHILGYTSPPVRVRSAGSLSEAATTYGPMIAYLAAFAGLSYLVLRQTEPRENPSRYELLLVSKHGGDASPHDTIADAKKAIQQTLRHDPGAQLRIVDRHTGKTVWSTGPGAFEGSPATRPPRPNPPVEAGTWAMHLQQHLAGLLHRLDAITPDTRFDQSRGRLRVSNLFLDRVAERDIARDAAQHGYAARTLFVGPGWMLEAEHPVLAGARANPGPAFTTAQAERAGRTLRVNYARLAITPMQLRVGMNSEREHSDVTHGSPTMTAKLALAHLRETPDYYRKLKKAGL